MRKVTTVLLLIGFLSVFIFARESVSETPITFYRANESEGPAQTVIDINNITVWVRGDGFHDWAIDGSWNGTFPKGTAGVIFSEGIVWAGKVNDGGTPVLRSGGSTYKSGNIAGKVLLDASGNVIGQEDEEDPAVRPYRVRPDFQTADLTDDAASFLIVPVEDVAATDKQDIYDQYVTDWLTWPVGKGAPFDDRGDSDGNPGADGVYTPDPDGDGIFAELEVDEDTGDTLYIEDIPGIPGAGQTLWTVYNDLDEGQNTSLYGAPSTGFEVQETYWAYAIDNPLGNTVFKRVRIIYVGTKNATEESYVEDMYISQWVDPDNGQYTDDFAGSDTTLSLGYCYNSSNSDAVWDAWGMAPPAVGYDFLQGPLLKGVEGQDLNKNKIDDAVDYALFDFKKIGPGYINLPMTAFVPFAAGSPRSDPTLNDYEGTEQWYNLMLACEPRPRYPDCDPILDDMGEPTHFELSGDPVLGSGDLDGKPTPYNPMRFSPGDRRLTLSTGPFTMARGDTQEVVVATIAAQGENFLQSVALLKFGDTFAQEAYDNVFSLPSGPPAPDLKIVELDRKLILEWESNKEAVKNTEESDIKGYKFEGYNVYQLPSATASKGDGKLLATFDLETSPGYIFQKVFDPDAGVAVLKPVQFGVNSGIQRYMEITTDAFTNEALINGKTYYFAVTAYNQNMSEAVSTHSFESPVSQSVESARPHAPNPQTIYPFELGDTLAVTNVVGKNDASVYPIILDPEAPNGETFEIRFSGEGNEATWDLVRTDTVPEDTLVVQSTNLEGDTAYRFLDKGGFILSVGAPASGVKSVTEGGSNVLGSNPGGTYYISGSLSDFVTAATDEDDYEIRFTSVGSYALTGATLETIYFVQVPFEIWDLGTSDSDTDDVQLFAYFIDTGGDGEWNTIGNEPAGDGTPVFDKIHIAKITYNSDTTSVTIGDKAKIFFALPFRPIDNIYFVATSSPPSGTTILFSTYKGIKDGDIKSFSVGKVERSATSETAKKRIKEINVFPNPYLGMNRWETSRFEKYVTFSHLPKKATIKIYNLAGVLVRTIQHEPADGSQYTRWDLTNEFGIPVASGIYIAHIDMPDLGEETVLKLAIIQEQQYLRAY